MIYRILFISFLIFFSKVSLAKENKKANEVFSKGLKFYNEELYQTAFNYFRKYLKNKKNKDRQNIVDAEYYLSICSLILKLPHKDKILKKFISKYGNHPRVSKAYFQLGNICFTENDFKCSIEYYNKVKLNFIYEESKYELFYRLGYSYLNEKNFEKAKQYFDKVKSQDHYYTHIANYYSGYISIRQEKYEEAIKDLKKASENESLRTAIPYLIAQIYHKQHKYKKLIKYIQKSYRTDMILKNQDEIEALLAESYRNLKDYESASKHYDNYILFRDNKIERDILFRNSYCLFVTKNYNLAKKKFQYLSVNNDELTQASSYYLGKIFLKEKKKEDALLAFERSQNVEIQSPIQEESLFLYSKLNYDLGKPLISISNFKLLKQKFPYSKFDNKINSFLSDLYLRTNNYDLAISQVEKENNKTDRMLKIYQKGTFYKGIEYFSNGEYQKAIEIFKKSLNSKKNINFTFETYNWLGDSYSAIKNYKAALNSYNKALKINPNNKNIYQTYYGLGFTQFKMQKYNKALKYFNKFYSYKSKIKNNLKKLYADSELRIADCNYYLNNYDEALIYCNKHLKIYPKNLHANLQKGIIYSLLGKDKLAEKSFLIVIKNGKHDDLIYYDEARFRYAHIAFKQANYKESIKRFKVLILERFHSIYTPSVLLKLAICHINLNENQEAIKLCGRLIHHFPKSLQAYDGLLEIQKIANELIYKKYFQEYKSANPGNKALSSIKYAEGKTYFDRKQYQKSISAFSSYIKNYPNNYNCKKAYYMMAQVYAEINQNKKSIEYYYKALQDDNVTFYNRALLQLARIEYQLHDFKNSLKNFIKLEKFTTDKKEKLFAHQGIMKSSYELKHYNKCLKYSKIIIQQNNTPSINFESRLFKAKSLLKINDKKAGLSELKQISKESNGIYAAEAHYLIAKDLYNKNKYSESLEELFKLTKEYIGYRKWTNKAFILIADNYISMGETFQAKATLKSIIDKSNDQNTITNAKERIDNLNKEQDKKLELIEKDQIKKEDKKEFCTIE
ncbi:MAG: tetratricopeptide repeat protein [Bacteroidetes bacterium]|nr:tetratricopeptide repeat protein [Bacteroidota bacterium]